MSANSEIEWTEHTFNIVWGCVRVSSGCQNCYAETLAKRYGFDVWGPARTTERRTMSDHYWSQPLRWNAFAARDRKRARVFCSSMADVFEDHPTNERERPRLFSLIERTPHLDWLLLTKRPQHMIDMAPDTWRSSWPENIVAMTSAENQEMADLRIPELLKVPAGRRGLSLEPLLGRIFLDEDWLADIHWVITGGESGAKARPMSPVWVRSLRDQAVDAGVPFFFKQWGEYLHHTESHLRPAVWREDEARLGYKRFGKKATGRILDGRTWDEYPELAVAV